MNALKKIIQLEPYEKKTMVELALKLSEEQGELAEAVLAFTQAPGSGYKNLSKRNILEEGVDILLVSFVLLLKAGFTLDDVEETLKHKVEKWQEKSLKQNF